jgi:hypothetical protein
MFALQVTPIALPRWTAGYSWRQKENPAGNKPGAWQV